MGLARQIASLGLAARSTVNLKVRQPLAKAMAFAGNGKKLDGELVEIITDELNVKAFELVNEAGRLVELPRAAGQQTAWAALGSGISKAARGAGGTLNPAARWRRAVLAGQLVSLIVDGETVELAPNEMLVQTTPVEGLAVAEDKGISVAVDAVLTR